MIYTTLLASALMGAATMATPLPQQSATSSSSSDATTAPIYSGGTSVNNVDLISKLLLAPTAVDRIALLKDRDFVYDFGKPPAQDVITTGKGGHTVKSDRKSFPALIGTGVSMTVGFIGPCGFNTPHVHPRSSEINIIVQGRLGTEFIAENGARTISNTLGQYQMTVFPKGATHTEFNPDCNDAVFVAGFADEDPGVEQLAQSLFNLSPDVVRSVLGVQTVNGQYIDAFRNLLPKNVALGVDQCLQKCGLQRKSVGEHVMSGV